MSNQNSSTSENGIRYAAEGTIAALFLWVAIASACDLDPHEPLRALPLAARIELSAWPTDGGVDLKWDVDEPPDDIDSWKYQFRLAGDSYGTWREMPAEGPKGSHVVEDLTNGLIYAFRVKFTNTHGDDVFSNEVIALPLTREPEETETPTTDQLCAGEQLGKVKFARGRHEVAVDYGNNRASLGAIVSRLNDGVADGTRILVTGHASGSGAPSHNLDLSEKRARAVATYLRGNTTGADIRLVTMAKGERHAEMIPDRKDERHQKVVVTSCRDEPEEAQN